jgi:hypothetical protein
MANCHDLFLEFYDKIILPETKKESLRKARDAIRDRIEKKFAEAGRTPIPLIRDQGSYATHTIINPIDGEYDIDVGVYLQNLDKTNKKNWPAPEMVHQWVYDAVDGQTDQKPIDKRTCVRVIYAGQYHVDLPIYAPLKDDNLHAEKGEKGWNPSDPQAIIDWFQKAIELHGDQLRRMVRYFKAWADYNSKHGKLPIGFIFTVLVIEKFVASERDDVCFGQLVRVLRSRMLSSPYICNPVDPSEDLYQRYDDEEKKRFLQLLRRLQVAASNALTTEGKKDACKCWYKEFGDRWANCDALDEEDKPRYTKAPAILKDDARSA